MAIKNWRPTWSEEQFDWVKRARGRIPKNIRVGGPLAPAVSAGIAIVGTPSVVTNVNGTAVLTCVTDTPCSLSIDYGTAPGVYDSSAFNYDGAGPDLELTTTHTVPLPDSLFGAGTIAAGLKYYRIKAAAAGASAMNYIDIERTFTIPEAPVLTYIGTAATGFLGVHQYNAAVPIGPAYPNRKVVFVYKHNMTSGTFPYDNAIGVSGAVDMHIENQADPSGNARLFIFSKDIPLGTTAEVFIQFTAAAADNGRLFVFVVDKTLVGTPVAAYNSKAASTTNSVNVAQTEVGVMVGAEVWGNGVGSKSASPSAPAGAIEAYEDTGGEVYVKNGIAATGTNPCTVDWTGSFTSIHGVVAWPTV